MLNATVQKLGDTTVVRCQGRIVIGDACTILRNTVLSHTHTRMLVLDLAQVDRIDAGGLGALLGLREWAHSNSIRLRLMNVMNRVEQVLELTKLDRVFEFCSVRDMFHLLHPAAAMAPWSVDQGNHRMLNYNCNGSVKGQDAPAVVQRDSLLAAATRARRMISAPSCLPSSGGGGSACRSRSPRGSRAPVRGGMLQ
jgi:anti-sigma B factor antagonist